jgi:nucleoredoxin
MKNLLLLTLALSALCSGSFAGVRKWTPADGVSKTFEGELTAVKGDSVSIKKKPGGTVMVPLATLSQADRGFVASTEKAKMEAAARAEATAKLKTGEVARAVIGNAVKLDGKKLRKADVFAEKAPQHYLLYWGASWCGPCRYSAPHLAGLYDQTISRGTNIEVIHLSCDSDAAGMTSFMKEMKLNFPAIPLEKWRKEKVFTDIEPKAVPTCKLVDSSGKVIAEGEEAEMKAKELAGAGGSPAVPVK